MVRPGLVALALLALASPALADRLSVRVVSVTDGDTLKARLGSVVERVRVVGLDAPERGDHARCRIEADLAERAWLGLAAFAGVGSGRAATPRQGPLWAPPGAGDGRRLLGLDGTLECLGGQAGDADSGLLLMLGHAGRRGGFTLRRMEGALLFSMIASRVELLQQLAAATEQKLTAPTVFGSVPASLLRAPGK